tara:strand:- start:3504 stop:3674 length:171 start_codon:yes stop_codon:yes gene_type:complete
MMLLYSHLHVRVHATNIVAVRAAAGMLKNASRRDRAPRDQRKTFYRDILRAHHDHQ